MRFKIPKIYPITDTRLSGLSHAEQCRRLIAGGARIVQLREKSSAALDWFEDARCAADICRSARVTLIVNDRVDIALANGAGGVHLGQDDLPPERARDLLGDAAIIGFSTHTLEQVRAAVRLPVDYIAFGPVFPTSTKADPAAVTGLEILRQARALVSHTPLVAIGGISFDNAASVFAAGADSLAVIGALVANGREIEARTRDFIIRTE